MSERTLQYSVTPFVDFTNETLSLKIELPDKQIAREVMNIKERAIREGLIALGWTPPGIADRLAEASKACFNSLEKSGWPNEAETLRASLAAYESHKKQTP